MDAWTFIFATLVMVVCWTLGEIQIKARFRPDVPAWLVVHSRTVGWVSLRIAGVVPFICCVQQQAEIEILRHRVEVLGSVPVNHVADRFTRATQPGLQLVDPTTGIMVTYTPADPVQPTQWRAQ